ncbi:hypothetical protein BDN67DRAFT_423335 [Paxillus ammoniavirescens]|nr:hypothetical protein BDN67DRAFT_423335 [Paxillus ammoniavirescens]
MEHAPSTPVIGPLLLLCRLIGTPLRISVVHWQVYVHGFFRVNCDKLVDSPPLLGNTVPGHRLLIFPHFVSAPFSDGAQMTTDDVLEVAIKEVRRPLRRIRLVTIFGVPNSLPRGTHVYGVPLHDRVIGYRTEYLMWSRGGFRSRNQALVTDKAELSPCNVLASCTCPWDGER